AVAGGNHVPPSHLGPNQAREDLAPLRPGGRGWTVGQGHATALGQAVDQNPFAFPPAGDALAAPLPRGKKRHPRRRTPNESSHVLQQSPKSALASQPGCHRPATAATSDASHSSRPTALRRAHHTSDNP